MKRICFFSGDITRHGGTERVSVMIANKLMETGNYLINFLSLTESAEIPFFTLHQSIKHYKLSDKWLTPGPKYLTIIPKLHRFIKEHEIEIIIDIDMVLDVLSIPAVKGTNTRIISWEHFDFKYEMASLYRRCILKYSVKHTDHIVTLTDATKRAYEDTLKRKNNITTIYNPIQELPDHGTEAREKWLITVTHLIPIKGIDYLCRVSVEILKKYPEWKWIVAGDGEERSYIQKVIRDNNLQKQLILTGLVNNINPYLAKARIFVLTSRSEGLPMVLLEAKAYRLPSVSFDISGSNEIIEDGVNGYLIKDFDCEAMIRKLAHLIENEALQNEFSANSWNNLSKFQMDGIISRWDTLLKQLSCI